MPVAIDTDYLIKLDIERIKKNFEETIKQIEKTPFLVEKGIISKYYLVKQLHSFWSKTCEDREFWTYQEEED